LFEIIRVRHWIARSRISKYLHRKKSWAVAKTWDSLEHDFVLGAWARLQQCSPLSLVPRPRMLQMLTQYGSAAAQQQLRWRGEHHCQRSLPLLEDMCWVCPWFQIAWLPLQSRRGRQSLQASLEIRWRLIEFWGGEKILSPWYIFYWGEGGDRPLRPPGIDATVCRWEVQSLNDIDRINACSCAAIAYFCHLRSHLLQLTFHSA